MEYVTFYQIKKRTNKPNEYTVLFAGNRAIYDDFCTAFPNIPKGKLWNRKPIQPMFNNAFYIEYATHSDIEKIKKWFQDRWEFREVQISSQNLNKIIGLAYHDCSPISDILRDAKPYDNPFTYEHLLAANELSRWISLAFVGSFWNTDYVLAVPFLGKPFDFPTYLVEQLSQETFCTNGSHYVHQIKPKASKQKDINPTDIQSKKDNVAGIFSVKQNHPFSGKILTIVDDIYESGATIEELAKVLKKAGAKEVNALVVTYTVTGASTRSGS